MTAKANQSTAPAPAKAVDRVGPYVLLDRIGRGGMAEVFNARLEREGDFKKLVAVKRMLPDLSGEMAFAQRFLDEARTVANLNHPNLVQVFDMGTQDGRPYLVMELVDGLDLWRLVNMSGAQNKPISIAAAVYIAAEVARGLGYVHAFQFHGRRLNIVHRDVSPQNLILGRNGEVKILDFGIAKANSEIFQRSAHTQHNAVLGKMRYMAPEQLEGAELDGRCDLYALGVVLYELLTAKRLIDAKTPASMVRQVREAKFDAPSKINPAVSPELDAIVGKLLSRAVEDRYADGATLAKELYVHLSQIAPGYGRTDLGELVESRMPMKPPAEMSSAAQEVSLASILEAEMVGTPPGGSSGAKPIDDVPANEPSGLHEFDDGIASLLEPLPAFASAAPEPAKAPAKAPSLEPEPSIQIIREDVPPAFRPTGALMSLRPEHDETRVELPQDVVASVLEQHLAAESDVYSTRTPLPEITPVPSVLVPVSNTIAPVAMAAPRKPSRKKGSNTVVWGAAAAVWVSAIAIAVVMFHSRRAPAVSMTPAPQPASTPIVAPPAVAPSIALKETPPPPIQEIERTARRAPTRNVRYLDGKIVVGPGQDAPPGAETAVARARVAYDLARMALRAGKHAAAAQGFEKSISEYPGYVPAYRGLASAYLADGQQDLALDALDTSARFASDADRSRLRTAIAMLQRGEEAELPPLPAP